jgi:ComF family protein
MGFGGLKGWFSDLLRIVFPDVCEVCGSSLVRGEEVICLKCDMNMPRTRVHNDSFNIIHERLAGKTPIERTAGYFYYYRESDYAAIIHNAKYNGRPIIARKLAMRFARELMADNFFDGIDIILYVPMFFLKKIKRGYNQSEYIAQGISQATNITVGHNLISKRSHSSQTKKNSYSRWLNAQGVYDVINSDELENKHVLIVDDVVTTGATLLACCDVVHNAIPSATISVLSLAVTRLR